MNRKDFLLKSIGLISLSPLVQACIKDPEGGTNATSTDSISGTNNGSSSAKCSITNTETEGPYPTHVPTNFIIKDIRADRQGTPMVANIVIKNGKNACNPLSNVSVDIWHCDADGNYSEYGNSTSAHFLRGRQTTDANGQASFQTIFPGWYSGRAVHIHVHVFDASGKSLLVTQIAFPAAICDTVYTTATNFYKRGKADTSNERDGIFSDGYGLELAGLSGSVENGYTLNHTIVVNA